MRFRPMLMTTMADFAGRVATGTGDPIGSELRRPLGITIIGGLIVSQMLTVCKAQGLKSWLVRRNRG